MSYRIDYSEEVSAVVSRLKEEHKETDKKLQRIAAICDKKDRNLNVAISLLNALSPQILRHAVEEEARLARVIMQSNKTIKRSYKSVGILQDHRRIKEFLEDELPHLLNENSDNETRKKIKAFVSTMIEHHREEEEVLFPLAMKADIDTTPVGR